MREIPLTRGFIALVSDEDYDLAKWIWHASGTAPGVYAGCSRYNGKFTLMHKVIGERLGFVGLTDHEDRNRLNNQRWNLRPATMSQNIANAGPHKNNTSGFRGVSWDNERQRWQVTIYVRGRSIALGRFDHIHEAAKAYNRASQRYFGEFGYQNPIDVEVG